MKSVLTENILVCILKEKRILKEFFIYSRSVTHSDSVEVAMAIIYQACSTAIQEDCHTGITQHRRSEANEKLRAVVKTTLVRVALHIT